MTILKDHIFYIFRGIKNIYRILVNNKFDNLYLPNFFIKNIIFINPNHINLINSIPMKFYKSTKFIDNFDWDKQNENISDHEKKDYKFIICKDFNNQINLNKSNSFIQQKENLDKYKLIYDNKKTETLSEYLRNILELFNSIKKKTLKKRFNNNIQFMIDRNFDLVKINSGDHRFAISRILRLKKIPIEIKLIHAECIKNDFNKEKPLKSINELIQKIEKKYN